LKKIKIKKIKFFLKVFSISAWVNLASYSSYYGRLLDFGNGVGIDNIVVSLSGDSNNIGYPNFIIYDGTTLIVQVISSKKLNLKTWYHVAATYDGYTARIYINGVLTGSVNYKVSLKALTRKYCYIGASNWPVDTTTNAYFDEISLFNNLALTQAQIQGIYSNSPYGGDKYINSIFYFYRY
jgi:hypothetical protein